MNLRRSGTYDVGPKKYTDGAVHVIDESAARGAGTSWGYSAAVTESEATVINNTGADVLVSEGNRALFLGIGSLVAANVGTVTIKGLVDENGTERDQVIAIGSLTIGNFLEFPGLKTSDNGLRVNLSAAGDANKIIVAWRRTV